ncbi:MAG TPA: pyridoxal-phosphate dependent enzyme [Spirochaetales bacterium]|nr:pyridoxal-phosphate dependent enzyme [Spirochaetales bacterium]
MSDDMYVCPACGETYSLASMTFRCRCGGLLDLAPFEPRFDPRSSGGERSIFRYASSMPPFSGLEEAWESARSRVTMGEGLTPTVPFGPAEPGLLVKVDYAMPTLSFKDRGAAVLVAAALVAGARRLIQDSSGNAGAAVAAYATRAGLGCDIYTPASTSQRKIAQIEAYGARAVLVPGSREDTAAAALEAAEFGARDGSAFYASHVYNPLFYQGTKTYVYELFETLGGLPDTLYAPLGNGTLVLGMYHALKELRSLGLIVSYPKLVAVQAERCAPVYRASVAGRLSVDPVRNDGTEAEGIAIAAPLRGSQVLAAIRELGGEVAIAPEAGLSPAKKAAAARGFYIETTSAACLAAYFDRRARGVDEGRVALPLCGSGLKSA